MLKIHVQLTLAEENKIAQINFKKSSKTLLISHMLSHSTNVDTTTLVLFYFLLLTTGIQ